MPSQIGSRSRTRTLGAAARGCLVVRWRSRQAGGPASNTRGGSALALIAQRVDPVVRRV
jgi:hypothetical protein